MRRVLVLGFFVLFVALGRAQADSLRTIDLRIPLTAAGPQGLEAVLVEPSGSGRHPLAVLNHGSPRDANDRPTTRARDLMPQLLEFAKRGYVAVAVLRRGYGTSGGGWAEAYGSCDDADYTKAGLAGASDIRAAIAYLSHRSEVDASKIIAVGVSAGGFATVALTADPPPGLVAAISFAGGRGSSGPNDVCDEDALVDAFKTYGGDSRVPMLWVYAKNDHFFYPALAKRLHDAFARAGGDATFVSAPAFGDEGHTLFSAGGISEWTPMVENFLSDQDLPYEASEDSGSVNLDPPDGLDDTGRAQFAASAKDATSQALATCDRNSSKACRIYAIDDALAP